MDKDFYVHILRIYLLCDIDTIFDVQSKLIYNILF